MLADGLAVHQTGCPDDQGRAYSTLIKMGLVSLENAGTATQMLAAIGIHCGSVVGADQDNGVFPEFRIVADKVK